jgi:enoyl-CoA hydratase/carnithine racemase
MSAIIVSAAGRFCAGADLSGANTFDRTRGAGR